MSSACVCHTDEWCFYCEMFVPLEKELANQKEENKRLMAVNQHLEIELAELPSISRKLEIAITALKDIKATLDMDRSTFQKFAIWDLARKTLEQIGKVN